MCQKSLPGEGYAIFLHSTSTSGDTMQVTDTCWGAQHAKWLNRTTLIVTCFQRKTREPCRGKNKRGIACLDVTAFVT
jgi:hypothetical protein